MIWILATRGAALRQRHEPYTETKIEGVHSVVYKPGIEVFPYTGEFGTLGTFGRGVHRLSGYVFSYDGLAAEKLLATGDGVDLLVRYRSASGRRIRTMTNVIFIGDATVTMPSINDGVSELVGVPFRVQLPHYEQVWDHVIDEEDN